MGIAEERVREKLAERRDAKDEDQTDPGGTAPPSQPPTA